MTHALPRGRTTPREMAVTELKSRFMDALDDARAGHVIVIQRNGRPTAALVPVEVAEAYEAKSAVPDHVRREIAAAVDRFRTDLEEALSHLDGAVRGDQPPPEPTTAAVATAGEVETQPSGELGVSVREGTRV